MSTNRHYPVFETDGYGLTKREYAAIKIMAGFAANPTTLGGIETNAEAAIQAADALFNSLEIEK